MKTLDQRSPYLAKRNRALKNLRRARRACDTLSGDYVAGRGTWRRYSDALDACFSLRETLNMLDAQHSAWLLDELLRHAETTRTQSGATVWGQEYAT